MDELRALAQLTPEIDAFYQKHWDEDILLGCIMIDIVNKNGDKINVGKLSEKLGCPVVEISALKLTGIENATRKAIELAQKKSAAAAVHKFAPEVESVIETVEKKLTDVPEEQKRFFAIKLLEKDDKIPAQMKSVPDVSAEIKQLEAAMDDDTESIITNERYTYISSIIKECYTKKEGQKLTTSDKIDKIVTNRWLALPIFAVVMFIVYYVSVTTVGTWATDWANDGVFGDGWHLFTIGTGAYEEAAEPYDDAMNVINAFVEADGDEALAAVIDSESEDYDPAAAVAAVQEFAAGIDASATADYTLEDEETLATEDVTYTGAELAEAVDVYAADGAEAPDPADYGIWVPSCSRMEAARCAYTSTASASSAPVSNILGFPVSSSSVYSAVADACRELLNSCSCCCGIIVLRLTAVDDCCRLHRRQLLRMR